MKIPDRHLHSIDRYLTDGIPMGHFLEAVFAHELFHAIGRADDESMDSLANLVRHIHSNLPIGCHGSYDKIDRWMEDKRKERRNA